MFLHLAFQRYYWFLVGLTAAAVWILREDLEADPRDARVAHPPTTPAPAPAWPATEGRP